MIASRPEPVLTLVALLLAACATPSAPPLGSPLEPLPSVGAQVPDEPDRVARDLARLALAGEQEDAERELSRLEGIESGLREADAPATGLVPVARDLLNATLDDPIAYRRASEALLERDDLSPALERRLEEAVADDPLALADRRIRDSRMEITARVFNAIVQPLARTATAGYRGLYGLARSLLNLLITQHMQDEFNFRERQALVHWKAFLETHPDAPEAAEIVARTEEAQRAWLRTRRDRALRSARRALEAERWDVALLLAARAAEYVPEDRSAARIARRAGHELARARAEQRRSLAADAAPLAEPAAARDLALALLLPDGDVAGAARALREAAPEGPLADEAAFAEALALAESPGAGAERDAWRALERLAGRSPRRSNMARHAAAWVEDPSQNPYRAFDRARRRDRLERTGWVLLGPLAWGPIHRDLPRPLEWLIDLPSFAQAFTSFPNRLVRYPWLKPWPFGRVPAVHARQYLARRPDGARTREVARWLADWEARRGNQVAAYEVARQAGLGASQEARLRERAAEQALEAASSETRPDLRNGLLRRIAREFQGTEAAEEAGRRAREEIARYSTQGIRVSRGFLRENPRVAGPEGLGLRPGLLDGDPANGELHPDGVILAGGRVLEFHFLPESGDKGDEPVIRRQKVSDERLSRLVALLDETARHNFRVDSDAVLDDDAGRDLYFERARLGVADDPDRRSAARSSYAFLGMRERYGLVRSREPLLPFDLVVQASLPDLSLAAFPRLRAPKPTPDAFLYR